MINIVVFLYSLCSLVRTGSSPEDQIILTVVANISSTDGVMDDLQLMLDRLTGKYQCQFRDLRRYGEGSSVDQSGDGIS